MTCVRRLLSFRKSDESLTFVCKKWRDTIAERVKKYGGIIQRNENFPEMTKEEQKSKFHDIASQMIKFPRFESIVLVCHSLIIRVTIFPQANL